jgi:hypothetical protein
MCTDMMAHIFVPVCLQAWKVITGKIAVLTGEICYPVILWK